MSPTRPNCEASEQCVPWTTVDCRTSWTKADRTWTLHGRTSSLMVNGTTWSG
jgi:hypothetical protein